MSTDKLPDGWTRVKFGDVVRKVSDRVDPDTAGVERYVAGEHMDSDDLKIRRWGEIGDGYLGPAFHMRFKPGQVLYGSRRTYLRKVAHADFEGICANTTFVLEPSSKDLLPEFLPIVMSAEAFHEHSIKQSKGSVNPYINFSDLTWYEFALPPIDEQQRIAYLLRSVDVAIDAYMRVEKSADSWITSYFNERVAGSTRVRLGDVAAVELGRQRAPKFDSGSNMLQYIRAANVKHGRLVLDDVLEMHFEPNEAARLKLKSGDVLVTEGCGSIDEIGANAVWNDDLPGDICFQNTVLRLRSSSQLLTPEFLQLWAAQAFVRGEFAEIATGTSIYHLGAKRTADMQLPLPAVEHQRHVSNAVISARSTLRSAQTSVERLQVFRSTFLANALVQGDIHV